MDLDAAAAGSLWHGVNVPRAPLSFKPLESLKVPPFDGALNNRSVPRARRIQAPEPPQSSKMAAESRGAASPRAEAFPLAPQPLQHLDAAKGGRLLCSELRPRAPLLLQPLQNLNVASPGCRQASFCVPRARRVEAPEPLQSVKLASESGRVARVHPEVLSL